MTAALPTIAGADLPALGWQHAEPFDPAAIQPVRHKAWVKPDGGLWTGVLREVGTSWTEWCIGEDWGTPNAPITRLIPAPTARVYVINTVEDLIRLEAVYPSTEPAVTTMWPTIAWEDVARDIDAIWLTDEGQWATRHSTPSLYGWDCETVLWLNPLVSDGGIIETKEAAQ